MDVRDVTNCMIALMESNISAEHFIISGENLPFRKIFDWIADGLNKPKATIFVNSFLREVAWRTEAMKNILFRTKPFITKETANSAGKKVCFSNEKIKKAIGIDFIPVEKSVKETCEVFLQQKKKN